LKYQEQKGLACILLDRRERKKKKGQPATNHHIVTSGRKGCIDTSNGTTKEHFLPSRGAAHAIQNA
jgi:hypothetical protein